MNGDSNKRLSEINGEPGRRGRTDRNLRRSNRDRGISDRGINDPGYSARNDHGNARRLRDDAARLASFLDVPLWDAA